MPIEYLLLVTLAVWVVARVVAWRGVDLLSDVRCLVGRHRWGRGSACAPFPTEIRLCQRARCGKVDSRTPTGWRIEGDNVVSIRPPKPMVPPMEERGAPW